ncbi:uncharacterized protein LOC131844595 [Achroia grisella]|uniref:uncharacterized protein LOC131844595 n=1 Tax=Achroia grisella TaxID=688607 RepID=UPI0027D34FFD|nr:uncharacterized protein LOC131844595 [Achroia grisella]
MDLLKLTREREQIRRVFSRHETTAVNTVDLEFLSEKMDKLSSLDKAIQNEMLNAEGFEETKYQNECDICDNYRKRWYQLKNRLNNQDGEDTTKTNRSNLKLPKLELVQFDDNPKSWLGFWSQFKKIHEDANIDSETKFQYLIQAMKNNSKAKSFVESYPPTKENYNIAVKTLKDRFAKEDILIEIYVRELLLLVSTKNSVSIDCLYDKIVANLQILESLGISKDKYECILLPMIESALPENLLLAWGRVPNKVGESRLSNLLHYLKTEVEAESRVIIAKTFFNDSSEVVPTAGCLVAVSKQAKEKSEERYPAKEGQNKEKAVRALLDSGSQRTYVRSRLAEELDLQVTKRETLSHSLFGGTKKATRTHRVFNFQVSNLDNTYTTRMTGLEEDVLCGYLPKVEDTGLIDKLKNLHIYLTDADRDVATLRDIDILIGSDYLGCILDNNLVHVTDNLVAIKTKLGWTLQGPLQTSHGLRKVVHTNFVTAIPDIDNSLEFLWNIETLGITDPYNKKKNDICTNISVNQEGRYEVPLLWKEGYPKVMSNYEVAQKRLNSCTKKLWSTGKLNDYHNIFRDWEKEGIIEKLEDEEKEGHYLPHHAVIKLGSTTTIRPVFDASSKDRNGLSLNMCIEKGTNLIELIPKLLHLFRVGTYGVISDIRRAFLQISVSPEDRKYLKFLWWNNPETKDQWDRKRDNLSCNLNLKTVPNSITKRDLLSIAQQIFDPIGFLCPVTLVPKLIIQKAWLLNTGWDSRIPIELEKEYKDWVCTIKYLQQCNIPRKITDYPLQECNVTVHVFCDASKDAYSGCVFLRTEHKGEVTVRLIVAKSRVAPIKRQMTLPRLELMGALMASRLYHEILVSGLFKTCKEYKVYCWTDSAVVLAWIQRQDTWKIFVTNRIKEICTNTNREDWKHLPGMYNPADLPSRGCDSKTLMESRWWIGPKWLYLEQSNWPKSIINYTKTEEEIISSEQNTKVAVNVEVTTEIFSDRLLYFNQYHKIVRLVAKLLRLHPRIRKTYNVNSKYISYEEYLHAERILIKMIQKENYSEKCNIEKKLSTIKEEGIVKVKTRLDYSGEDKDFIHPILLPRNNIIIQRMVEERHRKLNHAGTQTLLTDIRNSYWITGVRRLVKNVVSKCIICKRYKAKHYQVPEPPLPADRLKTAAPFEVTGIDLAGPLFLKSKEKCWIVLFTCAVYRAVHLELTESLSTNSFLMALRRFIARRGRVKIIYTDNGTNFLGAANLLNEINWKEVEETSNIYKIQWKFTVPSAPWWGGWWERLIRVVKDMLKRILGKASVDWIELSTILCDCEIVINSRPLTYVEMGDLKPLTPMLFLQSLPTNESPDLDKIDESNLQVRYKYLQQLRQDFRQRFKNEYLALLVSKKKGNSHEPKVGELVLIETDKSRLNWPLGLIKEIYKGKDGFTRVARVQTASGIKVRAYQRLYPLELSTISQDWMDNIPTARADKQNHQKEDEFVAAMGQYSIDIVAINETWIREGRRPVRRWYQIIACAMPRDPTQCAEDVVGVNYIPELGAHALISAELSLNRVKLVPYCTTYRPLKNIIIEKFNKDCNSIDWKYIEGLADVNEMVVAFNNFMLGLFDLHAPVKTLTIKHPSPPWLTDTLQQMMKIRDDSHKSADIIDCMQHCKYPLYADDLQLYIDCHPKNTLDSIRKLNEDLERMQHLDLVFLQDQSA